MSADSSPSPTVAVSVPIVLPTAEQVVAMTREVIEKVVREERRWLTNREAAAYLGISARTWDRKKTTLGVPAADIDGLQRYLRDDLDAVLLAHVHAPNTTVVAFPSIEQRAEVLAAKPEKAA